MEYRSDGQNNRYCFVSVGTLPKYLPTLQTIFLDNNVEVKLCLTKLTTFLININE